MPLSPDEFAELAFHGINTLSQIAKSVTHVSGTFRYLSLRSGTLTCCARHPVQGDLFVP